MAIVNVSDNSFKAEVEGEGTVLVDFWAPWCGPCKMIAPVLEELDKEIESLKIAKVNVDDNPESAARFGVMSIPTLIVFKDGQPVDKVVGFQSKEALKNVVSVINKFNRYKLETIVREKKLFFCYAEKELFFVFRK